MRTRRIAAVAVAIAVVVAACGGDDGAPAQGAADGRLQVVTTVSPITNIAANIGGGKVAITGIVPEGENSHEFEPAPTVARTMAAADLVIMNGLNLEVPTKELATANLKPGAQILELGSL